MLDRTLFDSWTAGRVLQSIGTNSGSEELPFQKWRYFKEAFAPEAVLQAVEASENEVRSIFDPFGGSGTTALSANFLGIDSTSVEVNPYLADLIRAKVAVYDVAALADDVSFLEAALGEKTGPEVSSARQYLPPTFVEPGVNGRWIFSERLFAKIEAAKATIDDMKSAVNARLMRVLLGGLLVDVSNVRVSGKGRRYRAAWRDRECDPEEFAREYVRRVRNAVREIQRHPVQSHVRSRVINDDSRNIQIDAESVDLMVCSPPYPNSFDYTDVYNLELWVLGYLTNREDNTSLRLSTLTSHVQIKRDFSEAPAGSSSLVLALNQLEDKRSDLWSEHIPSMIGAYFADMLDVLRQTQRALRPGGSCHLVVGDSHYAGVDIKVAEVLTELAQSSGFEPVKVTPFRSMRRAPQHGAALALDESLVVLRKM